MADTTTTPAWRRAAPADAGFVANLGDRIDAGLLSGLLRDLHGLVVVRGDTIVLERYWAGDDEAWGQPLGTVAFGPDTLHDLRSVTKSVVSLLYGIALDRGLVPPPDAPLYAQFPEHADLAADPARAALTIEHALTMTSAVAWSEGSDYGDAANDEIRMERAPDRLRFLLDRAVIGEPGAAWRYNGGSTALIGLLIERAVGRDIEAFAEEALFQPLGIADWGWARGADGVASAASGLRLSPRDLARIGRLVAQNGAAAGRQIVSKDWIAASTRRAAAVEPPYVDYGRFWFLGTVPSPAYPEPLRWVGGFGNGGQRLWIAPEADVVVASTSGAYNDPASWITPLRLWREIVMAGLIES